MRDVVQRLAPAVMAALVLGLLDSAGAAAQVGALTASPGYGLTRSGGGALASGPAVAGTSRNGILAFVIGTDGQMWQTAFDPTTATFSPWTPRGGQWTSDPSTVVTFSSAMTGNTTMTVFARGTDSQLYARDGQIQSNVFTLGNAYSLGGVLTSAPSAGLEGAGGPEDVFVRGTDNQLWEKSSPFQSSFWFPRGGVLTSGPGAVSGSPGRIDVFIRGRDYQLWHKWYVNGIWYWWEPLGGVLTSSPAAAACGIGTLDVFAVGTDGQLWRKGYNGTSWMPWQPWGGQWRSGLGATCTAGGSVGVFGRGTDSALWEITVPAT